MRGAGERSYHLDNFKCLCRGKKACGLNQCKVGAISIFKLTVQLIFFEGLVDVVEKP